MSLPDAWGGFPAVFLAVLLRNVFIDRPEIKIIPASIFLILLFCGSAIAGQSISIASTGTTSEQNQINEALKTVSNAGGGTVYLNAGVYEITGPIFVGSNTHFTGDKNAIIRVSSSSSQWFVGGTGLINDDNSVVSNVEISGFQIDGNLDQLPRHYADYGNGDHNAQRAIYFMGNKKSFMNNIQVHDMDIYDTYSDGIQIAYCYNAQAYNNFISNCQHSGIFFISVIGGVIQNNDVAGITSDCVRLDNCVDNVITKNKLYSYTGDNTNGQGPKGENGLQIADEGFSHGGGSAKPTHTTNIEVFDNVFANTGWHGVWLDSTGKGYDNVYIHDNVFLNGKEFTNHGKPVEGVSLGNIKSRIFGDSGYSYDNSPSRETSKQVFRTIFDILQADFNYYYPAVSQDLGANAEVIYYNYSIEPYSLVKVEGGDLQAIKYEYGSKSARHFIETDLWVGELHQAGNDLYIPGKFDNTSLKVTVYSKNGYQKIENIKVREVKLAKASFNPDMFIFLAVLGILGITTYRNLRRML